MPETKKPLKTRSVSRASFALDRKFAVTTPNWAGVLLDDEHGMLRTNKPP
jgi:hypothetical protein